MKLSSKKGLNNPSSFVFIKERTSLRNGEAGAVAEAIASYRRDRAHAEAEGSFARRLFEERYTRKRSLDAFVRLVEGLGPREAGRQDGRHATA